ncbi:hypothetical protein ACLKA7_005716 [Drosophila subpalustris]
MVKGARPGPGPGPGVIVGADEQKPERSQQQQQQQQEQQQQAVSNNDWSSSNNNEYCKKASQTNTMSIQKLNDNANSGYVSSEETDSLLVSNTTKGGVAGGGRSALLRQVKSSSSANGPTTTTTINNMASTSGGKPTLMRQDRTSTYLTSPQQSQQTRMGSEESMRGMCGIVSGIGHGDEDIEQGLRITTTTTTSIVPDIEVHEEDQEQTQNTATISPQEQNKQPTISIMNLSLKPQQETGHGSSHPNLGTTSYQNLASSIPPSAPSRCRACRNCSHHRRASTTPISSTTVDRSASRDSVKSAYQQGICISNTALQQQQQQLQLHYQQQLQLQQQQQHYQQQQQQQQVPPVLITSSPTNGSRIIRQSSQPESSSTAICCGSHSACGHSHTVPNVSLKQLRESTTDGIAGIAADSLRINGGMRPFKQCCQVLSARIS